MALITGLLHEDAKRKRRSEVPLQTLTVAMIKEMNEHDRLPELRILGREGHWYRVRPSGRLRTWQRDAHRVELPVKYGMYESLTLQSHDFDAGKVAILA